jgi:glycosyltransferase involved in cell wall biosynthesis
MNNPLVSVLIPCYNVATFVREAIDSVINQTYENLEIWLIDDASTDGTRQILESLQDKRIKTAFFDLNTKKVGAVNEVLKMVTGSFICFQDSDDYSASDRIQKQVEFLINNPETDICFTGYEYFGEINRKVNNFSISNDELREEFLNFNHKKGPNKEATVCASMMISQKILKWESGYHLYFTGRSGEDAHWIYRILKSFKGGVINQSLYFYRIRSGSFTQLQVSGKNAKYAYSWNLLSKIIYKDIHENIDLLQEENKEQLKQIELEACEEALIDKIIELNTLKVAYETSMNFRLGKIILTPIKLIKKLIR